MPTVLYTASTFSHIVSFHLPYLQRFQELGWRVEAACGGELRQIPGAGGIFYPLGRQGNEEAAQNHQCGSRLSL